MSPTAALLVVSTCVRSLIGDVDARPLDGDIRGILVVLHDDPRDRGEQNRQLDAFLAIARRAEERQFIPVFVAIEVRPADLERDAHAIARIAEAAAEDTNQSVPRRHLLALGMAASFAMDAATRGLLGDFRLLGVVSPSLVSVQGCVPQTMPRIFLEASKGEEVAVRSLAASLSSRCGHASIAVRIVDEQDALDDARLLPFLMWVWGEREPQLLRQRVRPP